MLRNVTFKKSRKSTSHPSDETNWSWGFPFPMRGAAMSHVLHSGDNAAAFNALVSVRRRA